MIAEDFKEEIEKKLGKPIEYSRDCKVLSESIFEHTGRAISPTTLKRVFGLTSAKVKASRYTLDSLAVFVGYKDWDSVSPKETIKTDSKNDSHLKSWSKFKLFHNNKSREGLEKINASNFDLIILDVMMPKLDGLQVCKQIRDQGLQTPVLFLTVKGNTSDRIRGLEAGGDDYLAKPFELRELLLRVAAILRRTDWYREQKEHLIFGDNEVNFHSYHAHAWDGSKHALGDRRQRGSGPDRNQQGFHRVVGIPALRGRGVRLPVAPPVVGCAAAGVAVFGMALDP